MKKQPTTRPDSPALVTPPYELPTTFQLAQLAASLLIGREFCFSDAQVAVWNAGFLWEQAYQGVCGIQAQRSRQETVNFLESKLPKIINEWPKDANEKHCVLSYNEGIVAMFPHDKANSRDGLMLELLVFLAKDEPDKELGRENWRRLKSNGFTYQEFLNISYSLTSWRSERISSANSANAKKAVKKKKKELGG
ncbi:hypothetical protein GCM10023213_00130 [Prosthecobacter algae]|uniref:Uncharacterized protein n=1 Tax=Prosthecobacter algae TaxID=1144682 RepID=A0ABP9NRE2_9BACT